MYLARPILRVNIRCYDYIRAIQAGITDFCLTAKTLMMVNVVQILSYFTSLHSTLDDDVYMFPLSLTLSGINMGVSKELGQF